MTRDQHIPIIIAAMRGWTPALRQMLLSTDPAERHKGRAVAAGIIADRLVQAAD